MVVKVVEDYEVLSNEAAVEVEKHLRNNPAAVLCLAAGDTPRRAYQLLSASAARGTDFSRCTFIALDEWVGIGPENQGSCAFFLRENLFRPLNVHENQIFLFDALSADPALECERMNRLVREKGGIDLMLVGVGMNGHIGFNEPGADADREAHVVALDETTRSVGQKYFAEATALQQGLTLGLKQFLNSRKAILIASGAKKADIVRRALEGPVTDDVPASMIRNHPNGLVLLDRDAASMLADQGP